MRIPRRRPATVATASGPRPTCCPSSPLRIDPNSTAPLNTTAGMDRRNEKRAALVRSRPKNRPAVSVAPERDTPGMSASA